MMCLIDFQNTIIINSTVNDEKEKLCKTSFG